MDNDANLYGLGQGHIVLSRGCMLK